MDVTTTLNAVRDAIKSSSAIVAWAVANYDMAHTLYVGLDAEKPPASDECPVVYIYQMENRGGWDVDQQELMIGVICAVFNRTMSTSTVVVDENNVTVNEYDGAADVEALRKLVLAEVAAVALSNGDRVGVSESDFDVTESFPFFLVGMDCQIVHDFVGGEDPMV